MAGTFVVGMLVGLAAWGLFPVRGRLSLAAALVAGAAGSAVAFYGGRALRLFVDGQMVAWAAIVAGAVLATGLAGAIRGRRG